MLLTSVATGGDNGQVEPTPDEIRGALERVVASPQFVGAERLRRFLTHVVERAIEGRADELKEFTVAGAVFDRDASYDPRLDAVVRVEAGRLRSRLGEYYADGGASDPVVIRVPKGGYAPVFERRADGMIDAPSGMAGPAPMPAPAHNGPGTESIVVAPPPTLPPPQRSPTRATWVGAGLAAAVVLAGALAWYGARQTPAPAALAAVAVLPLDGDRDVEITRALSLALVPAGNLEVIAHSRVREAVARGERAGKMATAFGASYTVEGRVESRPDALLIEVVLVDARHGRKLWVDSFAGPVATSDTLVRDAAAAIAQAIAAHRARP